MGHFHVEYVDQLVGIITKFNTGSRFLIFLPQDSRIPIPRSACLTIYFFHVKADEKVLAEDGLPDIAKVKPFIFDPIHQVYTGLGSFLGKAFSLGKRK